MSGIFRAMVKFMPAIIGLPLGFYMAAYEVPFLLLFLVIVWLFSGVAMGAVIMFEVMQNHE